MGTTAKGLRYPESSNAPNVPQYIQNLASDVNGKLFTHGGSSGVMAGSAAPTGEDLIIKTYRSNIVTNSNGDGQFAFPGGAFPNGLLAAHATCATGAAEPFFWVVWGATLSSINLRGYNILAGAVAGSLSITTCVTLVGW